MGDLQPKGDYLRMPQVPSPVAPSISPSGVDTPFQSSSGATAEAFGAGIGQAESGLSRSIEGFSDVLSKHAVTLQDRANAASATDLYTQATLEVGNLDAKFGQLEGKARADALPEYQKNILDIQAKYQDKADNVEVRKQFDNDFKRRAAYSIVDESKHAAGAMKQYNIKSQAARITLADQDAAASARDDNRFGLALQEVKQSVDALGRENSWGADEKEVFLRKQVDGLYETRFKAMAITDPFKARELYNRDKDKISGPTQLKIENDINNGVVKAGSRIDAQEIWNKAPPVIEAAKRAISGIESGSAEGNYNSTSVPSKDGDQAYGRYQVMGKNVGPWTEQYYGKKLTPQEFLKNPEAQEKVFEGEFGRLMDKYGPQGAARAWYAGEGGMNNLGATDAYGKLTVADYGSKFAKAFGNTQGDAGVDRLQGALGEAKEYANKRFPDDPGFAALYEDTLTSRIKNLYSTDNQVRKEQRLSRQTTVMSELLPKPDGSVATQLEQLSPAAQQAYNDMEPDQKRRMLKQLDTNAKQDVILTPERYSRFQEAMGKAITNPDEFNSIVPGELDIPRTLQSQIFTKQRQMQGKLADTTKVNTALRAVQPMLNDAGIFASRTDTQKNASYNQFVGAFDAKLKEFEDQYKKFPTEEEQRKIASGLLTETTNNWVFSNSRAFEVPQNFTDEWTPKFQQKYGRKPTQGELFRLYQLSSK